ncbi:hypothetical protein ACU4GD_46065 [Cupriavidus basilensis]
MLACTDFPLCNGQLGSADGLLRTASRSGASSARLLAAISSRTIALVAIHWTHRVFAVVVLSYSWRGLASGHVALAALAAVATAGCWSCWPLQLATGLSNIVLGWPLLRRRGAQRRRGRACCC